MMTETAMNSTTMTSDVLTVLNNLPAENRPQCIYELCLQLRAFKNQSNVALGKLFDEIDEKEYYSLWTYEEEGKQQVYDSFNHFCMVNYEYSRSTSQTFIRIYRKFCKELQVPEGELAELPWGNLKLVLPHVNEGNLKEVLTLCKGKQKDVRAWALMQTPKDPEETTKRYSFTCSEEQAETIDLALDAAERAINKLGGKVILDSHKWEFLCSQYLLDEVEMNLSDYLILLERKFDVSLQIAPDEAPLPKTENNSQKPAAKKSTKKAEKTEVQGVPFDFEDEEFLKKKMEEAGLQYGEVPEDFPDVITQ
jgi:hypothetical protein